MVDLAFLPTKTCLLNTSIFCTSKDLTSMFMSCTLEVKKFFVNGEADKNNKIMRKKVFKSSLENYVLIQKTIYNRSVRSFKNK